MAALTLLSSACISTVSPTRSPEDSAEELDRKIGTAVAATLTALPPPTPFPTPIPEPTATERPLPLPLPTSTPQATQTPQPEPTPVSEPVPPPLEVTFLRIFSASEQAPQFQVQVKNVTDSTIVEYNMEICPTGLRGQGTVDPVSGRPCFVVSDESVYQPANARPPTGYVEINEGLYEKTENDRTLQWAISRYPSWVGTGFESARGANVALTYARFENGDIWEDGMLIPSGTR